MSNAKKAPKNMEELQAALQALIADGTVASIIEKYIPAN